MATLSAVPFQRPKKLVRYGKTTSRSTWSTKHVDSWLDDDEDMSAAKAPVLANPATVKASYAVKKAETTRPEVKSEAKKHALKPVKQRAKEPDAFDVPSSEDEAKTDFVLRRVSPPKAITKRTLVDDTASRSAELTPSEKARARPAPARQRSESASPERRPKAKPALDSNSKRAASNTTSGTAAAENTAATGPHIPNETSKPMSAAARLAARRQQASNTTQAENGVANKPSAASKKRRGAAADATAPTPRKRSRKSSQSERDEVDVPTVESPRQVICKMPAPETEPSAMEVDVYAFPDDDEDVTARKPSSTTQDAKARRTRRGKASSSSPMPTPKKGLSAPARLTEMLPIDTDSTDAPSRSPSILRSSPCTPRRSATPAKPSPVSTPSAQTSSSPQTALKDTGAMTPKQAQLWSQLLQSDPPAPTPSSLAIKDLTLSGQRRGSGIAPAQTRSLLKSSSDVTTMNRRRTRLVDRLKGSAPSSEGDSSEAESDVEMEDLDVRTVASSEQSADSAEADDSGARASQSQSQSQSAAAESGPRITYARTRSYLPEDHLEDGLMFDLPSITPQRPPALSREPSKTNAASQKSAFDLDDSDNEGAPGRMRTIHELRAAGRNNRFMQETEGLLEDIADYNVSGKSRRRGALIELGTKLMDKSYAERFVGQGFEHKLISEVSAGTDPIADFVLTAAFALVLAAEPPKHTVTSLNGGGVLPWLAAMLTNETEVGKLVRDGKNNMSKAAQSTLVEFAKSLQARAPLWTDLKPASVTPRLVALRALDLMVGRLRRLSDRTELLDATQLESVLPHRTNSVQTSADLSIAISLLEALSSSALTLAWPTGSLDRLSTLLPTLGEATDATSHTTFLALRLTLNVTNDNPRNCQIFARETTVQYLLTTVETGFAALDAPPALDTSDEKRGLDYDLLVLAMGCMINLAEHSDAARQHTVTSTKTSTKTSTTEALLAIFVQGQQRIEDAKSLSEGTNNVAFGYLAVMLANVCQSDQPRDFVARKLPGGNLGLLVEAVSEFGRHHEKVDTLSFGGEEGMKVWGAFTEKLRAVLGRLRSVSGVV